MTAIENLRQYFGYETFREGQETLINDILGGKDVLGIMPTGAGKSVCFQIPATIMDGITLVVSPLISLMKDQVNALIQAGITAAFINSSLTETQIYKAVLNARSGMYKLIYVAPERLLTADFLSFAQSDEIKISMLTVDEAHCISQWGQDFRPSYAKIPEFIAQLGERPVVSAFTATATPAVRKDIINLLGLKNPGVLVSGFDRQNLYFEVKKPKNKYTALTEFLKDKKDRNGIIYCSTRAAVEEVCERLNHDGYNATRYHAGLPDAERHRNQDDFLYDRVRIMTATNAFGMGIDKSNVSFVVHYNMPKDIESYYQEAGRAGRDGEPADCVLFYNGQDVRTNLWLIENDKDIEYPDAETGEQIKERARSRLRSMTFYCATNDCLRGYILKYFGETPPNYCGYCGSCGSCSSNFETVDITVDAQKIISCVARMKERYGVNMVIDVLRGSRSEKILSLGLEKLSTYGISQKSDIQLRDMINYLILSGYLVKTDGEYPVIKIGEHADEILHNGRSVYMKLTRENDIIEKSVKSRAQTGAVTVDRQLLANLKELRMNIAKERGLPPYVIFPDSALIDMCVKLPGTKEELLTVSGVGRVKSEQYGERFLKAISEYTLSDNIKSDGVNGEVEPRKPKVRQFDASAVEISEDAVTVSIIADRINCALIEAGYDKINGKKINDWLVSGGYMTVIEDFGKNFKIPTETGTELGITNETRVIRGEDARINMFNPAAQKYIVENALQIIQ